jgi:hypothetical protein
MHWIHLPLLKGLLCLAVDPVQLLSQQGSDVTRCSHTQCSLTTTLATTVI